MKVKSEREVAQSCPTLSDPMDYSLPGCSIHGIFQARVLEWGAIAFSILFCLPRHYSVNPQLTLVYFSFFSNKQLSQEDPLEKKMATHSSTLAWKIPWTEQPVRLQSMGLPRVGTTERLHFDFSLSCIGESNGNPLQCSCLENPRDGRAWWVAQSQTRLKQLSSSSKHKIFIRFSQNINNIICTKITFILHFFINLF